MPPESSRVDALNLAFYLGGVSAVDLLSSPLNGSGNSAKIRAAIILGVSSLHVLQAANERTSII